MARGELRPVGPVKAQQLMGKDKARREFDFTAGFLGGPERARTADLCVANAALSQLSYRPSPLSCSVCLATPCIIASPGRVVQRGTGKSLSQAVRGRSQSCLISRLCRR